MPLNATCSNAISAACHRPEDDKQAYLFPVKWGMIPRSMVASHSGNRDQSVDLEEIKKKDSESITEHQISGERETVVNGHFCFTTYHDFATS